MLQHGHWILWGTPPQLQNAGWWGYESEGTEGTDGKEGTDKTEDGTEGTDKKPADGNNGSG